MRIRLHVLLALAAPAIAVAQPPATPPDADVASPDDSEGADGQAPAADPADADGEPNPAASTDEAAQGAPGASGEGASVEGASAEGARVQAASVEAASVEAASVEAASAEGARPAPRVATTLLGDPEPVRQQLAESLDAALEARGLVLLGDPVLRAALRGEGADDGLDRVRAERRRLGWGEDTEDAAALQRLGTRLRVDALVVLRPDIPLRIAVFDVRAGAFYEDEPQLSPEQLDATARFIVRAARAARRRTIVSPPSVARAASPATEAEEALPPARRWLRKYWAYLVGGALLVAVVVVFALRAARDDVVPAPVLRFRPGPRPLEP